MAKLFLQLSSDEVNVNIPYAMVCMTRYGASWNRMFRKLRWTEEFTEQERNSAERLFKQSHDWLLGRGVPSYVKMTFDTFNLWHKLGNFCASI